MKVAIAKSDTDLFCIKCLIGVLNSKYGMSLIEIMKHNYKVSYTTFTYILLIILCGTCRGTFNFP